jgi:tetratricopeptide (TPR) repeat protein
VRVVAVVATAGLVAIGAVVGITLATRTDVPKHRPQGPPFASDPTATADVRAAVREALAAWPTGTLRELRLLAVQRPRSALVRFALALGGQSEDAKRAWRAAERAQPDSPSAVRAEDALHPEAPAGKPPFVASFARPRTTAERLLARGIAFQAALRPVSAERAFATAAHVAPDDAETQVAAAVGLYDKDRPAAAFSRLGPLARRFPRAQTVRFHLGLLLLYLRAFPQARKELALAVAAGPKTPLAKQARTLLKASQNA